MVDAHLSVKCYIWFISEDVWLMHIYQLKAELGPITQNYINYNYSHNCPNQLHCFNFNYIMRNQIYSAFVNYVFLHVLLNFNILYTIDKQI